MTQNDQEFFFLIFIFWWINIYASKFKIQICKKRRKKKKKKLIKGNLVDECFHLPDNRLTKLLSQDRQIVASVFH